MKYIALLRGINVSGHKIIAMDNLKKWLTSFSGFSNVETYIQSGNIVFTTNLQTETEMADNIAHIIKQNTQFEVPVLIITPAYLQEVLNDNPFADLSGFDPAKMMFTFLNQTPSPENIENMLQFKHQSNDVLKINGKIIYLYCPDGYGKTKLNNNLIEQKLKVNATTRNYNTVLKLLAMAAG
ncbi:MAG: DUF1697 domain-containing protein [Sphingobacteriales bacterium]|jgi:uncharacterized protein (DUF1697 family)|nr:DUF1697 domain-containing protein [Sphingobacteriales bacterium]MBP9142635.1 DUF1697 domain-containing protein [Chitinophagales bacterium]MDA0199614.1 DUF1697 domain-containing protein [Bacteroidota bacterium]MBK6888787.1 DUF1697 domain-containing protein [Sphingobacteriales bacterium]MBK7528707.1 DUF1697 domain-containing protein [Sphingobacteriales bacterium]